MKFRLFRRESNIPGTAVTESQAPGAGGTSFTPRKVSVSSEHAALTVGSVYRAVDITASSIAMMTLRYMRLNSHTGCYVVDDRPKVGGHLNYLLGVRPNRQQNAFQFWKAVVQRIRLHGNAFILPVRDVMQNIVELVLVRATYFPATDTVVVADEVQPQYNGTYMGREVVHLMNITEDGGYIGKSTLKYAFRTLGLMATSDELSLESVAKGGRVKGLITEADSHLTGFGRYDPKQMEKAVQELSEKMSREDITYMPHDGKFQQLSLNAQEMQIIEQKKFGVSDVARFFGVPRNLLMDDSNSSYKTPEASNLEFLARTLQPLACEIESEFTSKLLYEDEYPTHKFEFDKHRLFMLDINTMGAWKKNRLQTGTATVNELRSEENLPRVEGGDRIYVDANVKPLEDNGQLTIDNG